MLSSLSSSFSYVLIFNGVTEAVDSAVVAVAWIYLGVEGLEDFAEGNYFGVYLFYGHPPIASFIGVEGTEEQAVETGVVPGE